ncbi:MAG: hypothetical protein IPK80_12545 [Nannocystis sp.]|nr:hypothetical protein [Nannocystis sp.]
MKRLARLAPLLAALALPHAATAGGTRTHTVSDFDDFDAGEAVGAAIEGSGRVTVAYLPARAEITAASAFVCHAAAGRAYIGTADPATIQVVTPGKPGKPVKDAKDAKIKQQPAPKVEQLAELPGVVVTAITELPGGDLLAATLPGGVIHRVTAKGKVSEFAKLDVGQIWAITPHKGRILVATGPKGELYSLDDKGGDAKVILDSDDKDLLSLLVVGDAILVGTAPGAKLLQVTSELDGVLLHDFAGDELRALALAPAGLLAAVNEFTDRGISSLDALTKNLNRSSLIGQPSEGISDIKPRAVKASAKLYHVHLGPGRDLARAGEATWEAWLSKDKLYFTDIEVLEGGAALVSSSFDGKIYRVRGRRDLATVLDLEERQATALCRLEGGALLAAAGDGAAVYRLDAAPAITATYKTKIFDAKQPATYGELLLRGRGDLKVRARVGPSDTPDKRWTAWSAVPLTREPDGLHGRLRQPLRRYLQLEVTVPSADAELREIVAFYAPENLPPLVKSVELSRPEVERDDDDEPPSTATIKWKADAADDDELVYEVRVRPEGADERQWIKLNGDAPIDKKELKWDLASVPDGTYEVEVRASDEPSNGVGDAGVDALVSAPFVVDRTRPRIESLKVSATEVSAVARDDAGHIHDVAFSVDGGPFRAASPRDGVFDGRDEPFTVPLPEGLSKGRHRLVLRARDAFGNLGTLAVIVDR